jgi:hypothetical protein
LRRKEAAVPWMWTLRKRVISAFVLAHTLALSAWNLPAKVQLRERVAPLLSYYMLPTGLWQDWGMFAPDPARNSLGLEAVALDRHGILRHYAFPSLTGLTVPDASWRFRHAKYVSVIGLENAAANREFAARTVLRRLDIPPEAYPVDVQLLYKIRPTPPPGEPAVAATADEPSDLIIATFRFPTRTEVDP